MQRLSLVAFLTILLLGNMFAQSSSKVEEASRFRGNQAVVSIETNNISSVNTINEVNGNLLQNKSNAQLEELGSRYTWAKSNAQLEELGSRYFGQNQMLN